VKGTGIWYFKQKFTLVVPVGIEPTPSESKSDILSRYTTGQYTSERRDLNSQLPTWKDGALPIELLSLIIVAGDGIEPS